MGMDRNPSRRALWPKRLVLATLMAVASINIFTGAPLLALWLGSKVQGSGDLTMGIVFAVIGILAAAELLLAGALSVLGRTYDALTGRPPSRRQTAPWLRSMRAERVGDEGHAYELSGLEKILVLSVVVAVGAFEVWFFFFAGSSLPKGS